MNARPCAKAPSRHDLLPVVLACELGNVDIVRQWLVEPLWARAGVGILGGAPKSNKSWCYDADAVGSTVCQSLG